MSSRIEQLIEEIEDYIADCKYQHFSQSKIIVDKDELEELLDELKSKTPEEIKRYQKIISNKDAILSDAQKQADAIIAQAQIQTNELVSEHEIMQRAFAQGNEVVVNASNQAQQILDKATADANEIRTSAIAYVDNMLMNIEKLLTATIEISNQRQESFVKNLQSSLDIVTANRIELNPPVEEPEALIQPEAAAAVQNGENTVEEKAQ
ncbi:MAG: ATPase [Eubacterium sp.]|nr:ATPase [Eubacterium sp.]